MAATTALVAGTVAASAYSANKSSKAASKAADVQSQSSQAAIDEQRRQFDIAVSRLSPYANTGQAALGQQNALLGINGDVSQYKAIQNIQNSPYFQAVSKQGNNAILQNASATGGVRGGNTEAALAQFQPQLLNQLIQQRLGNLSGVIQQGQAAAAGQAASGQQTAANVGNLLGQQGQAQAGGIIGQANAQNNLVSNLIGLGGAAYGAGAF